MKNAPKIAIVILLALAVAATFALRARKRAADSPATAPAATQVAAALQQPAPAPAPPVAAAALGTPRLLELGSNRCMACQQMAVVLDALRASQGAKLRVDFIDVMENPELGEPYKISLIPTQILYDAAGKEIFRHVGFFSHEDILAKFRALKVKL
jgi:thioredoxin 1